MTGAAATWLPPELTHTQPYSMGPVTRWSPPFPLGSTLPAGGTIVGMDRSDLMIATCFVAPARVQRAAQKAGQRGIIMAYPKGLLEALGLVKAEDDDEVTPSPSPAAAVLHGQAFVDALMALDDEED